MSTDDFDSGEDLSPPEPPSSSAKLFVRAALGCAVVLLAVVAGLIAVVAMFGAKGASTDPRQVELVCQEIAAIQIPRDLQPVAAFRMPSFLGQSWVYYHDPATRSTLVLNMSDDWKIDNPQRARALVERSLRAQHQELVGERIQQRQTSQQVVNIQGTTIPFTFIVGQGLESKTTRISVIGVFPGRTRRVLFLFDGDAHTYPERQIIHMLEAIGRSPSPHAPAK
jgi:hypothetical protein